MNNGFERASHRAGVDPPFGGEISVQVIDIFGEMKVVGPRASFSDRGLSHQTFNQVIDTEFWLVVGPRF